MDYKNIDKFDTYLRMQNITTLSPEVINKAYKRYKIFEEIWDIIQDVILKNPDLVDEDLKDAFKQVDKYVTVYGSLIQDQRVMMTN